MSDKIERFLDREELQLATIGRRSIAFFIDAFLLVIISIIIHFDAFSTLDPMLDQEGLLAFQIQILETYLPLTFIYQWIFTALYGATIGKIAMKIKVINLQTGDIPDWMVSLNRAGVRIISEYVMNLGFLWALFDPAKQGWHDKSAKTIVINA